MLRPGRFDRILEVSLPDVEERKEILRIHTKRKPLVNKDKLIELTQGYTGADIAAITNAAAMSAIKEYIVDNNKVGSNNQDIKYKNEGKKKEFKISMKHFEAAIQKIKKKATTTINNPNNLV